MGDELYEKKVSTEPARTDQPSQPDMFISRTRCTFPRTDISVSESDKLPI
ncbi:hypothetical protein GCM10011357_16200 [Lacimicrobium alkaliphilum]|uniref:Uncharacterized protein n=1 Tax=Lacimicrobium alkaliphilum TaxID=1526571 RepID=A0ABQ1R7X4_9ALTE|nr:hypothetical protein GCM10011357_16200 [Lacimicrobium alkaliphilum]